MSANDDMIQSVIDRLWMNLGSPELKGLTPYQAARKLGLNKNGAEKVEKMWDGPDTL